MTGARLGTAVAVLLAVLVGAVATYRFAFRSEAVQVVVAAEGVVEEEIRAPGSVSSRTEVEVSSRVAGVVVQVSAAEGDRVEAGQLLAALDDRELAGRASTTRAAAESARHNVVVAEAALDKARADLALARTVLTREADLAASGHVTKASLDATQTALSAAEAAEKGAIATLETRRADARRLAEEARLAETLQSYAQITSPQAGLVTKRQVEVGTTVAPGAMLFRVVDAELVCVETRVDVSQMGRVAVGLPAKIRLASGDELTGSVARVAHEADPVTRDQEVRILFDRPPDPLTLAEEAQVVLRIGLARGLVVPGGAVVRVAGKDTVLVAQDGHAVQVPVVVRAMGQGAVVVEGLTEGDQVVLEPQTIRPGQRLRPVLGE